MRYLGIDFGTSKVGLALSDEAGQMGFPKGVLQNDDTLLAHIIELIEKEKVGAIVIGESTDFTGNGNPVLAKARAFANALTAKTDILVAWEPEMFSTQEARRGFEGERGHTTATTDASAAALILTSYLSRNHG